MCKNLFLVRTSMTETDGLRVGHKTLLKKNDILCVLVSVFILDILPGTYNHISIKHAVPYS